MLSQNAVNDRLYQRDLVQAYAHTHLTPAEAIVLVRYRDDIVGRRVLDVGCGAGRLAGFLRPLTDGYVGVDVSAHMIEHCWRTFPGVTFVRHDMRALPCFADGSFDTAVATANLLDAVTHDDRLRTLAELHRVIVPDGLLLFSSHNRHHPPDAPHLERSRNPITQTRNLWHYVVSWVNHRRLQHAEYDAAEYAVLNDSGHDFAVLHYYIDRETQTRQLSDAGFELVECIDELGCRIDGDDRAASAILYVARRG